MLGASVLGLGETAETGLVRGRKWLGCNHERDGAHGAALLELGWPLSLLKLRPTGQVSVPGISQSLSQASRCEIGKCVSLLPRESLS